MCPEPTATTNATLDEDVILPFMRLGTGPGATPPRPPRPSFAGALDDLSEVTAMVGLTSLAAETLPAGHRREFCAILEVIHCRLSIALQALQRGAGEPPLEPVEA